MSMTGCATRIRIKDDTNPQGILNYANAKLQLSKKSIPKVVIAIPPDDENVFQFKLADCTYMDESSTPGSVECIRINSEQQTVIIIGPDEGCIELLDHIKDYLANNARRAPTPPPIKIQKQEPKPPQDKKVNELIGALHASNAEKAATIARDLAKDQQSIRFALDMINESGNTPVRQPPQPVVEPFRLKVSIESFLIDQGTDELYDVAILPKTTIKDLKQLIRQNANIDPNQQYWYINRELLDDNYTFDVKSTPRLNDKTVLILYITKPPNH